MVVYLCSDAAQTITGSPISIDGGWGAVTSRDIHVQQWFLRRCEEAWVAEQDL